MSKGTLYYSGGVKSTSAHYHVDGDTLIVEYDEGQRIERLHSELDIKPKLGQLNREILIAEIGLLVCPPTAALDQWLDGKSGTSVFNMESKKRWVLTSILLVPLLIYGLFAHLLPFTAIHLAQYVPMPIKQAASQQTLAALDYTFLSESELNKKQQELISQSFREIIEQVETDGLVIDVQFRYSDEFGPNAFALPDGTIVFTDQIIELMDYDQQLLDAILLHEIGHVKHNHSMRMVAESMFATMAITYFFGDLSGAIEAFFGIGTTVVQNSFSQAHEWEADNFALSQLNQVNRSPEDFAQAMEKLASLLGEAEGEHSWLSSHPMMRARIENAQNYSVEE